MEKPETIFPSAIRGHRPIERLDDPFRQIVSTLRTEGGRLLGEAFDLPADAKVFIHLCGRGEATASDLIALELASSTVYRALGSLRERGVIEEAGTVRRAEPDEGGKSATRWRLAKRYEMSENDPKVDAPVDERPPARFRGAE
jgi:DNA-binding transcriptional ArsR family regulator